MSFFLRDAVATGAETGASSLTFAHVCDPTVLVLYTAFYTSGTVSGVTYNGVAMTSIDSSAGGLALYVYGLKSSLPTDGLTHNIVITLSGAADTTAISMSYKGTSDQTIVFSAHTNNAGTTTPLTTTISDTYKSSWTILAVRNNTTGTSAAGTGSALVTNANGAQFYDSNGSLASAGSQSMAITFSGGNSVKTVMAEIGILQTLSATAAVGTFSLTGFAATLQRVRGTLTAAVGTFSLTGIAATFLKLVWGPSETKNNATFTGETRE